MERSRGRGSRGDPATTTQIAGAGKRADTTRWLVHGVVGGIVAGVILAMFEMIMAAVQMGGEALFMPLRMIGGIALGPQAMAPRLR